MDQFIPFALPDIDKEEIDEVVDTLRSGWITTGPKTKQFEVDFGEWLGEAVHCISVNSATAGLHLSLEAIGVGPGDEVVVPTHTFTATAEVVRYLGADPVFVDIDLDSYCIDVSAIEDKITSRTKVILPVHYAGHAAGMKEILSLARRHGIRVVEDAAHALPTRSEGKLVGTLASDCTVFSFYATKTIATGEGGMVVTRDAALAARMKVMRLHGIDRDAFDRYSAKRPAWYYEVVAPGYKYNLTDIASSLGIQQLRKAHKFHHQRTSMATEYDAAFRDMPFVTPPRLREEDHAWHLYVIRLLPEAGLDRNELMAALLRAGIGTSVHYVPLHQHPYWRDRYGLDQSQFPRSQLLFETCLSLPIYTKMTAKDQDRVISAVRGAFSK